MAKYESEGVSRRDILGTGLTVATLAGTTGLVTGGAAVMIAQPDTAKADDDRITTRRLSYLLANSTNTTASGQVDTRANCAFSACPLCANSCAFPYSTGAARRAGALRTRASRS